METNSIVIPLDVYNGLRDFRREIEKRNCVLINFYNGYEKIYTIDNLPKELIVQNKKLSDKNKKLRLKISLKDDISKMSLLKLIKWWFSNRNKQ